MVKWLNGLVKLFLFILPWQTIWIYRTSFLNGVKWEYGTLGFFATEFLLWMIIILFIVWYWRQYKIQDTRYKIQMTKDRIFLLSLLSLISYLFISIIWSSDKSLALQQSLRVMEAILLFLIIFIGPFEKGKLAKWFVLGAVLPALLGIYQFATQSTFAFKWLGLALHLPWEAGTSVVVGEFGRFLRAYGSFSHPNVLGGYLAIVIVILLVSLRGAKRRNNPNEVGDCHASPSASSGSARNDMLIYCLLITSLFFSFSRSALLAFAIVLLTHYFIVRKYHFIILSFIIITILSIIFFPIFSSRLSASSTNETQSITERVGGYSEAWQIFKQHPMLGVGAGNYTLALYQLNPDRPGWEYQPAHNAAVLFVVENGMIGFVLVVLIIFSLIAYRLSLERIGDRRYVIFLVLPWLVLSLCDHYLYSSYIGLMLTAVYFSLVNRYQLTK